MALNHSLNRSKEWLIFQIRALLISHPHEDGPQSIAVQIKELTRVVLTYKLLTQLNQSLASKITLIKSVLQLCLSFVLMPQVSFCWLRYQHLDGHKRSVGKVGVKSRWKRRKHECVKGGVQAVCDTELPCECVCVCDKSKFGCQPWVRDRSVWLTLDKGD